MPKRFPDEQRFHIFELARQGLSYTEIAEKMKKEYPEDWSSDYAHRTVAKIVKEEMDEKVAETGIDTDKTLDEMSRDERYRFIEARLSHTPRFRLAFKNFDEDDKSVFIEEYLSIIRSTETLTEAEEQALFAAIMELVLAFKALGRKETQEKLRDQSLSGEIPETDPRFTRHVDSKYQKEHDDHMKLYQKGMSELKMSRSQRLKEVRSQKQTLVDVAAALSQKNAQAEVADEIERLSKYKDEQLIKLLEEGHIHGVFESYQ